MTAHDHHRVIAIDGPGAAGKTTVATELADRIEALLFDTGALYRAVTLAALRQGVSPDDPAALTTLAQDLDIVMRRPTVDDGRLADVILDGEDVTWAIRTPEVDANVSAVSAHADVRDALLEVQRKIANGARVVMVGRDIGTVVVPDAGVKVYLDASVQERARRRYTELRERGANVHFDDVLRDLQARDEYDSQREVAPLRAADDAVRIVTDGKTVAEIVAELEEMVTVRWTTSELSL